MGSARYDRIGVGYDAVRRPDPRIAELIRDAIGQARSIVNVGAGSGAYERIDIKTVAIEPSAVMIAHRAPGSAPVVQAAAEDLPFDDDSFDVGLAVFTVHHWADAARGLTELCRVSRRQVILTWDPIVFAEAFWFARDYLPSSGGGEEPGTLDPILSLLPSGVRVEPVPVPADCTDGFYACYWARPAAYLDSAIRAGISALALSDHETVSAAVHRLEIDLVSGAWRDRNKHLLALDELDVGYRLMITE